MKVHRTVLSAMLLLASGNVATARYMEPATGRFLTDDPLSRAPVPPSPHQPVPWAYYNLAALREPQRLNRCAYAGNNPINRVDPFGLDYLRFTGQTLNWVFEQDGVPTGAVKSWPASSGWPARGLKTIPSGTYTTSPADRVVREAFERRAWGPVSYRLHESILTRLRNRTQGRSGGFFIHGGYEFGTAGCIEFRDYSIVQPQLHEFDELMKGYGKQIRLDVGY